MRKLSVTDTGTGMTPEQLHHYINQLAASGREQSSTGNFGVGAKVAAGSRNPHGLEYRSWPEDQGARSVSSATPTAAGDSNRSAGTNGRTDFWRPLGEADEPWLLRGPGPRHAGRAARPA